MSISLGTKGNVTGDPLSIVTKGTIYSPLIDLLETGKAKWIFDRNVVSRIFNRVIVTKVYNRRETKYDKYTNDL